MPVDYCQQYCWETCLLLGYVSCTLYIMDITFRLARSPATYRTQQLVGQSDSRLSELLCKLDRERGTD